MFGEKETQYSQILRKLSIIDKLEIGIGKMRFPERNKILGYTWEELKSLGTICETVQSNDDGFVTILREFISNDKTMTRSSNYTIDKNRYEELIKKTSTMKIYQEIEELEEEIKDYADANNHEICEVLKEELAFFKETFNIVE